MQTAAALDPSTADPDYIQVFIFIKHHLSDML